MKYVRVEPLQDLFGYMHDPQPYLEILPQLAAQMPLGAAEYASAPGHYDFGSTKCVKDLTFGWTSLQDASGALSLKIYFEPNEWKHESGLLIEYADVQKFQIETNHADHSLKKMGSMQLDEVLPSSYGLTHEFAFTGGTLMVTAKDLDATWTDKIPR
ncbi:hypothetical protein [Sinosporangium siamense]|uniref:Uncharacterized protein n=1 Tax=Sinosporangium siamense TaxID=1367973 RepID=A0A919VA48_9ACTN|nr:hypothetical protein [Sinosporangium siamense]GII96078.1 hypothetical protein Ssi02_63090 [Sinosporangium siamense]